MTQIRQDQIKRFRKAFPELGHYSDAEAMAYCRDFSKRKKQADRFIEGRIRHYSEEAR